jgi:hypothetical protein
LGLALIWFRVLAAFSALGAQADLCAPAPEIQEEIAQTSSAAIGSSTVEQVQAALRVLRDRYPDNLFVHLRYQDAINERGIEGRLRELHDEYLSFRDNHSSDLMYQYLYARVLAGRNTSRAIRGLEALIASHPDYAPAHRALAQIYASAAFGNRQKEQLERAKFKELCPGVAIERWPAPTPPKGALWARAESLLNRRRSDPAVPDLVSQALQVDESRLQRIRPYDWYTPEFKKQVREEVQLEYWRGWRILVQHFWKTQQADKAEQLLAEMQDRLARLRKEPASQVYWTGATSLLKLYSQGTSRAVDRICGESRDREMYFKFDVGRAW